MERGHDEADACGIKLDRRARRSPTARVTLGVSKIACDSFAGYKIANRQNIAMTEFCDGKCADTIIDT